MAQQPMPRLDRSRIDRLLLRAATTREVVVERGALASAGAVIARQFPSSPARLVADEQVWRIAGQAVQASLDAAGHPSLDPIIFPSSPPLSPDFAHIAPLREQLLAESGTNVVPVAVGTGALNDLVKLAAHEAGLPYTVVATAASMDGYTASGAALVRDGVKQTFPCAAPALVIADTDVLAAAPAPMTASGYGDLVGKVTAGADWILADALGIEPLIPDVWDVVQGPLRSVIAEPERIVGGDLEAIERVFLGLVTTGLAMQVAGSSRPASGSEHQFSHLWEMQGLEHDGRIVSHGYKVGVGSIGSTALYEQLLDYDDLANLEIDAAIARYPTLEQLEQEILTLQTQPLHAEKALEESRAKHLTPEELRTRLETLKAAWPSLSERVRAQLLPVTEVRELLDRAGCPTTPEQIGLTREELRASYTAAHHIRRRYTVFDLATELGQMDRAVEALFAPGGYWATA